VVPVGSRRNAVAAAPVHRTERERRSFEDAAADLARPFRPSINGGVAGAQDVGLNHGSRLETG